MACLFVSFDSQNLIKPLTWSYFMNRIIIRPKYNTIIGRGLSRKIALKPLYLLNFFRFFGIIKTMFICETCLKNNYTNFAIPVSYGKCEDCGEHAPCCDIQSKNLSPRNKKDSTNECNPHGATLADYPHPLNIQTYFALFCPQCGKKQASELKNDNTAVCMVCGYSGQVMRTCEDQSESNTFTETIGLIEDLKNEFVLLESIRQTAKELCDMVQDNKHWLKDGIDTRTYRQKLIELKHLVTD